MTVHVLYENDAWLPPLLDALASRGLEANPVFVDGAVFDLRKPPPEGVYVNRMSPSAHTRGHQVGVSTLTEWLPHLEHFGRAVINGSRAFALEVSKLAQDRTLRAAGIETPHTIGVVGRSRLVEAGRMLPLPFLTKHNQGGKGLGVHLFRDLAAYDEYVVSEAFSQSPDEVTVLQQYIEPPKPFVTRVEIVGGVFQYAIRSSTVGGFELCPADACALDEGAFCPVGSDADAVDTRFTLREDLGADDPLVKAYISYCAIHGLDVAGIEFVEDADGRRYTYDVNANSNYNSAVERAHGLHGMGAVADLCAARSLQLAAK